MTDYLTRVAEAVRDACAETCNEQHTIAERRPIPATICAMHIGHIDLPAIIASVPRPEPVRWLVYVQSEQREAVYQGMEDVGYVDDLTNHEDAEVTPLYAEPVAAQPAVPDGWKLVPVEPTIAMCIAGDGARLNVDDRTRTPPIYRAMLAAAPEAPQPVLDRPASIGGTTFGVGIPVRTLVAAAQRRYEAEQTPASLADRQALIDALRRPVVDAELTTLREQNAALEQDAARYHALRAELIRADGPVDERGEIEKAIKEVMRKAYAERGDPMPTAAEFDAAIDAARAQPAE